MGILSGERPPIRDPFLGRARRMYPPSYPFLASSHHQCHSESLSVRAARKESRHHTSANEIPHAPLGLTGMGGTRTDRNGGTRNDRKGGVQNAGMNDAGMTGKSVRIDGDGRHPKSREWVRLGSAPKWVVRDDSSRAGGAGASLSSTIPRRSFTAVRRRHGPSRTSRGNRSGPARSPSGPRR